MNILKENIFFIWLSSIEEITPAIKLKLLQQYGNLEIIFKRTKQQLEEEVNEEKYNINMKIKEKIIERLIDEKQKRKVYEYIDKMQKLNINVINCLENKYPKKLKEIYDFPICLYYKGNINILNAKNTIAIIGCRECSNYGGKIAKKIAYELSSNDFIVISGGARGIDSFSHIGAILANKPTIEVLGNGIDYIYPPENKELEEKILYNKGLIISEYIIGTRPSKYTFPARNRIISALSDGVLVVEAKQKSGTLITVDFALEQGKNIYAIPGNIDSLNSISTNQLIKEGAKIVTCKEDILEDFI